MTPPRTQICLAIAMLAAGGAWAAAPVPQAQPLPTPFPEVRYREMSTKSPFAVASAPANATAAPTPGFAADLYVNGVLHYGDSDFAAIKSRDPDKQTVLFLEVGKTSDDGMRVDRINWATELPKSTVDVSKGGEKATLVFDEAQAAKNLAATAPPPGQAGIRLPARPGSVRLPGFNPVPQPMGPNRLLPQGPGQPNPGMPNGVELRRRIRGIQSGQ